jgi:hypothetical protein
MLKEFILLNLSIIIIQERFHTRKKIQRYLYKSIKQILIKEKKKNI